MNILLDTHIALWALVDPSKLDSDVSEMIESPMNRVYYSVASVWEIAIKHSIKPDKMPISEENFVKLCNRTGFILLEIKAEHIFSIKGLKRSENCAKHNDPFDRVLIAQAKCLGLKLLTSDSLIKQYDESCIMYMAKK